jgi:hypothetical protein
MLADTYRKARAQGTPARYALTLARMAEAPCPLDFTTDRRGRETATIERDGFRIVVTVEPDEYVSLDDLGYGHFSGSRSDWRDTGWQSRPEPDAIRVHNGNERDGNTWYVPGQSLAEAFETYHGRYYGASRAVALDMARERAKAELRSVDPGQYGPDVRCVKVTVYRKGIELAEESVCGVEIGDDAGIVPNMDERWLAEAANDLIPQALDNARAALADLCSPEGGCA